MPELPELETIKKYLKKSIVGKKIVGVKVLSKKQFPADPKTVLGARILSVERRAKMLILELDNQKSLAVHLKLSGQLVWIEKAGEERVKTRWPIPFAGNELPAKSTRVVFKINGGKLFFNELRKFGWIKVLAEKDLQEELRKLGPEPFSENFSEKYLAEVFRKSSRPIKIILMDQEKIAGVGNIYANEALYLAGINPKTPARDLAAERIKILREKILEVLKMGIRYEGASDVYNVKPDGSKGSYQEHFLVYRRVGEKCSKCGGGIKRIQLGGRGTFFCPYCQK